MGQLWSLDPIRSPGAVLCVPSVSLAGGRICPGEEGEDAPQTGDALGSKQRLMLLPSHFPHFWHPCDASAMHLLFFKGKSIPCLSQPWFGIPRSTRDGKPHHKGSSRALPTFRAFVLLLGFHLHPSPNSSPLGPEHPPSTCTALAQHQSLTVCLFLSFVEVEFLSPSPEHHLTGGRVLSSSVLFLLSGCCG